MLYTLTTTGKPVQYLALPHLHGSIGEVKCSNCISILRNSAQEQKLQVGQAEIRSGGIEGL